MVAISYKSTIVYGILCKKLRKLNSFFYSITYELKYIYGINILIFYQPIKYCTQLNE